MLIHSKINTWKALQISGTKLLIFILLASAIGVAHELLQLHDTFLPSRMLVVLGSAVGIFLAFRINSGYERWWEARKIWGELLIASRSLGISIIALLRDQEPHISSTQSKELQKTFMLTHIGYVNALRLHLRKNGEKEWQAELWGRKVNGTPFFSAEEIESLKGKFNIPCQIIQLQNQKLIQFFKPNPEDLRLLHLLRLLNRLDEIQGKCERIKNTVFPWGYAFYTHRLVWLMAILFPLGFIQGFHITQIILCSLICTTFITIEQVGRNLDNPFENSFNDTPMSALCRLIEIDLLEQLGEPRTEPLLPQNGVLQ